MRVNPIELERAGDKFRQIREQVALPEESPLRPGRLSAGLADLQTRKASAAARFAHLQDAGLAKAGEGLIHLAKNVTEFDRQGAAGIQRLFPDTVSGVGGGQR